jgi:dephospho-CoA kinase
MKTLITLLTLLSIAAADEFDWDAAERNLREERATAAACSTMRTDTAVMKQYKRDTVSAIKEAYVMDPAALDSIETIISRKSAELYRIKQLKVLQEYEVFNKIEYLKHLLKHHIVDTATVFSTATVLHEINELERVKLEMILSEQRDGNTRATINLYIHRNRKDAETIAGYIKRLSEKGEEK